MIYGYLSNGQPDAGWWMEQVRQGIEWRKEYAMQSRWESWRKMYRGRWPANTLPVNLYFRMLRTIVPRIYFRNPAISIVASKPGTEQQMFAQLIERIDNKLVRTMDVKNQMKRMIHNTWMFGTGAGKLGFGAEFTPTPDLYYTDAPEKASSKLIQRVEYNSNVSPNMPWFMSVHTGHFIVPKGLADFASTPWVGMWVKRSVDDVQSDKRLKNAAQIGGSSGRGLSEMGSSSKWNDRHDEVDLVEIRDKRTRKVIILAPYSKSGNHVVYYGDDELQNNNRPNIYPLVFNPDDEVFWGVPDSIILEPQQLELNEIKLLQMKHRRMELVKFLVKRNTLKEVEIEKLVSDTVGAVIQVDGEISDIDNFNLGGVPEGLYRAAAEVQADVRDNMGFSRNQAGEYASQKSHNAPTATESQIVQAASEIRVDERRDSCADVLTQMFEDANQLVFNKWADDEVVQIMGPDSIPLWVAFKPAMLKAARYEITVEPDSTLPETKGMRAEKATALYERLKTNPLIDPNMLTQYFVREAGGIQLDTLIKRMEANAAAGVPGSSPDMPIGAEQLMQKIMGGG